VHGRQLEEPVLAAKVEPATQALQGVALPAGFEVPGPQYEQTWLAVALPGVEM